MKLVRKINNLMSIMAVLFLLSTLIGGCRAPKIDSDVPLNVTAKVRAIRPETADQQAKVLLSNGGEYYLSGSELERIYFCEALEKGKTYDFVVDGSSITPVIPEGDTP